MTSSENVSAFPMTGAMKVEARSVIFESAVEGTPRAENFSMRKCEIEIPEVLPEDSVVVKLLYLSPDPFLRNRMNADGPRMMNKMLGARPNTDSYVMPYVPGWPMDGFGVGQIVRSTVSGYPINSYIGGMLEWTSIKMIECFSIVADQKMWFNIPADSPFPLTYYTSVLGMPGWTGYLGLTRICKPKAFDSEDEARGERRDTLFVDAASGAVGQLVGQLGKAMGAHVVGCCGSDEKVERCLKDYGYDAAFNYKTCNSYDDMKETLRALCPYGIDCAFENVGGFFLDAVLANCNRGARIAFCGAISTYNAVSNEEKNYPFQNMMRLISHSITLRGFVVSDLMKENPAAPMELAKIVKEQNIKYAEDIVSSSLENPSDCEMWFAKLFSDSANKNGKIVVKIDHSQYSA